MPEVSETMVYAAMVQLMLNRSYKPALSEQASQDVPPYHNTKNRLKSD
ncbi:MAG TPA: hypothetical protein V6D14_35280 [Coleofasciculaceae cyanobacterium]